MEHISLSSWDALQGIVMQNPRIHALYLRNYMHVWTRTPDGDVLQRDEQPERKITRRQILRHPTTAEELRNDLSEFGDEAKYWNVSVSSRISVRRRGIGFLPGKLGKKTQHIALLDMDLPISEDNTQLIAQRVSDLLVKQYGHFMIAESGNSYHLIGMEPMSIHALRKLYGTSLLLDMNKHIAPDGIRKRFVDTLYVGHSLERNGTGHLRMTGNVTRKVPKVVGRV